MSSLSFPDINVWLAFIREDHVHRPAALNWWKQDQSDVLAFIRFTQLGVLRLLATPAAMNNRPLTMPGAWAVYDALFNDARVTLVDEPPGIEGILRRHTSDRIASPKFWADAYLLAFAEEAGGSIVTFDRPLASRAPNSILLT
jgi:toxin-antitoxin system PIN domain toxin